VLKSLESYLWVPPATKILANFHGCIVTFDGQGFDCWIGRGYMWFHSRSGFLIGSHTGVDIYIYIKLMNGRLMNMWKKNRSCILSELEEGMICVSESAYKIEIPHHNGDTKL